MGDRELPAHEGDPLPGTRVRSHFVDRRRPVYYSEELGRDILDLYVEGHSLQAISLRDGMPSYLTILRWARELDGFHEEFERARAVRAIHMEEQALQLAEDHIGKNEAPGAKVRFEIFKWAAEVGDAGRFGKKVTVAGDSARPIVFKVVTGVPAPETPQIKLDKSGMIIPAEVIPVKQAVKEVLEPSPPPEESLFDRLTKEPYKAGSLPRHLVGGAVPEPPPESEAIPADVQEMLARHK